MTSTRHTADRMDMGCRPSRLRAWLYLLRVPNLFTVPGDPLAGFLLASWQGVNPDTKALWPSLLASLCFYCAGLLSNDYFDRDEDARDRPQRPLPQGWVTPGMALGVAVALTLLGIALATQNSIESVCVALLLAGALWSYNAGGKREASVGPYLMGLCRALSLLLGATAFGMRGLGVLPTLAAGGLLLYIAAVTILARRETETRRIGPVRWLPTVVLLLTFLPLFALNRWGKPWLGIEIGGEVGWYPILLAASACGWTFVAGMRLQGLPTPAITGRVVGDLIRGLLIYQALFCAFARPFTQLVDLVLLLALPVSYLLSRKFYAS